jgi:hypothetical protein
MAWSSQPESGGQLGERLAFMQVGEDEKRPPPGIQLPPPRPNRLPVAADDPGHEGEGPGRQRQRGTVESMEAPGSGEAFLADRLTYRGLADLTATRHTVMEL